MVAEEYKALRESALASDFPGRITELNADKSWNEQAGAKILATMHRKGVLPQFLDWVISENNGIHPQFTENNPIDPKVINALAPLAEDLNIIRQAETLSHKLELEDRGMNRRGFNKTVKDAAIKGAGVGGLVGVIISSADDRATPGETLALGAGGAAAGGLLGSVSGAKQDLLQNPHKAFGRASRLTMNKYSSDGHVVTTDELLRNAATTLEAFHRQQKAGRLPPAKKRKHSVADDIENWVARASNNGYFEMQVKRIEEGEWTKHTLGILALRDMEKRGYLDDFVQWGMHPGSGILYQHPQHKEVPDDLKRKMKPFIDEVNEAAQTMDIEGRARKAGIPFTRREVLVAAIKAAIAGASFGTPIGAVLGRMSEKDPQKRTATKFGMLAGAIGGAGLGVIARSQQGINDNKALREAPTETTLPLPTIFKDRAFETDEILELACNALNHCMDRDPRRDFTTHFQPAATTITR